MKRSFLLVFVFCHFYTISFSQTEKEIKNMLLGHIKKMNDKGKSLTKQYQFMDMILETKNNKFVETNHIQMIANEHIFIYQSTQNSIYQDEQDTFTFIHPKKLGFYRKSPPNVFKNWKMQGQMLPELREKLVETGSIKSISDTTWQNKNIKKINLDISEDFKAKINLVSITYYYSLEEDKILGQILFYKKNYQIEYQKVIYNELNYDYKGKVLSKVKDYIFSEKNQFLPKFAGYTLQKN